MSALAPLPLPPWVDVYLTELARHGMAQTAAVAAQTTVRAVAKLIEDNSEFAYAVEDALERSADAVEAEVRRRAIDGIDKGIYFQGELVATEKQYSDQLLTLLAKAKRRREFGDKQEITGAGGGPLIVNVRTFAPDGSTLLTDPPSEVRLLDPADPDSEPLDVEFRAFQPSAAPLDGAESLV